MVDLESYPQKKVTTQKSHHAFIFRHTFNLHPIPSLQLGRIKSREDPLCASTTSPHRHPGASRPTRASGVFLFFSHFGSFFSFLFSWSRRDWTGVCVQSVVPLILLCPTCSALVLWRHQNPNVQKNSSNHRRGWSTGSTLGNLLVRYTTPTTTAPHPRKGADGCHLRSLFDPPYPRQSIPYITPRSCGGCRV